MTYRRGNWRRALCWLVGHAWVVTRVRGRDGVARAIFHVVSGLLPNECAARCLVCAGEVDTMPRTAGDILRRSMGRR